MGHGLLPIGWSTDQSGSVEPFMMSTDPRTSWAARGSSIVLLVDPESGILCRTCLVLSEVQSPNMITVTEQPLE